MRRTITGRLSIVVLGSVLGMAPLATPAQAQPVTLTDGHADAIDVDSAGGSLTVQVLDGTGGGPVERDPADVTFDVPGDAKVTVPGGCGGGWGFLGDPEDTVWVLPQDLTTANNKDLLWLGWNTEEVASDVFEDDELTVELVDVESTGSSDDFSVYTVNFFGCPSVVFDSGNGLPDTKPFGQDNHAHFNWAFEATGEYTVTVEVTGTLDGTTTEVRSGPVELTFDVHN